jgi:hypothetical protein
VDEIEAANRYVAMTLLADPGREPDKVKRARLVSGYQYGLQWWLRDGYYWRLKESGVKRKTTSSKLEETEHELA